MQTFERQNQNYINKIMSINLRRFSLCIDLIKFDKKIYKWWRVNKMKRSVGPTLKQYNATFLNETLNSI